MLTHSPTTAFADTDATSTRTTNHHTATPAPMPVETRAAARRRIAEPTSDPSTQGSDQDMPSVPRTEDSTRRKNNLPKATAEQETPNKKSWVIPVICIVILIALLMLRRLWGGRGMAGQEQVLQTKVQPEEVTEQLYPYFDSAQMAILKRPGLVDEA